MSANEITNPVMRLAPKMPGIRCYALPAGKIGLDLE